MLFDTSSTKRFVTIFLMTITVTNKIIDRHKKEYLISRYNIFLAFIKKAKPALFYLRVGQMEY